VVSDAKATRAVMGNHRIFAVPASQNVVADGLGLGVFLGVMLGFFFGTVLMANPWSCLKGV
jgi:hypothetical protein